MLGQNPWKSPLELWAEKTGKVEPDDLSEHQAVHFGHKLEPIILDELAERTGRTVERCPQDEVLVSSEHDWLRCTPDAIQRDGDSEPALVEAKTAGLWMAGEWKEEPPLHYQIQLQHQLAVTGYEWGTLACLVGGQQFVHYDCDRNQSFIDAMLEREAAFWDCVQKDIPPAADATLSCSKAIAKLYPADNGEVIELPHESESWDSELRAVKEQIKELEKQKRQLENYIKAEIGSATVGILPCGSEYTLRTQTRKEHLVKESTFRVLRRRK